MTPEDFPPVSDDVWEKWRLFGRPGFFGTTTPLFQEYVGLTIDELREGWCRMRMTFREELHQAAGIVHGGAIASLLDSALVPAIGTVYEGYQFSTLDLHVQYLRPLIADDAIAEGWIVKRGRRIVFGQAEARAASTGATIATAVLTYHVAPPD